MNLKSGDISNLATSEIEGKKYIKEGIKDDDQITIQFEKGKIEFFINQVTQGDCGFEFKNALSIQLKISVESDTDSVLLLGGNRKTG